MRSQRLEDREASGGEEGQQAADQRSTEPGGDGRDDLAHLGHQRRRREVGRGQAAVEDGPEDEAGHDADRDAGGRDRGHLDREKSEHLARRGAGGAKEPDLASSLVRGERRAVRGDARPDDQAQDRGEHEQGLEFLQRSACAGTGVIGGDRGAEPGSHLARDGRHCRPRAETECHQRRVQAKREGAEHRRVIHEDRVVSE